jgi:hypothetical protein
MVRRFKASAFPFAAAETVPATLDADDISAAAVEKIQDGLSTFDPATQTVTTDAEAIWAHSVRTLTSAAQVPTEETSTELVSRRRGDSWSVSLTGLGNIADRETLWLTIKRDLSDADADALLQITEADGLTVGLSESESDASIAVDDEAAGDITIVVAAAATRLAWGRRYDYDIQVLRDDGTVATLATGEWRVVEDVTRSVE